MYSHKCIHKECDGGYSVGKGHYSCGCLCHTTDEEITAKFVAAQLQRAADVCPRCGGSGEVRNDGFVWVMCHVCDGTGKRR